MKKLISIRGAVTAANTRSDIACKSRKLVDRIYFKNGLTDADVVNAVFSVTSDLTAEYPAHAVRETGRDIALFSCVEPNIDGALRGCIRVMITAYSDEKPRHIYLGKARSLRPDLTGVYSIALDGPSGAGKSTVAKQVAKRLGLTYLDTGALYRTLGLKCLDCGVGTKNASAVEKCLKSVEVGIEYADGVQRVLLDGSDVSGRIRTPEVSMAASDVSAVPYVREKLLDIQRDAAKKSSVILDGRDIGTVVLPDAEFKFYLTASAQVRAKRRYDELIGKGQDVTLDGVLRDVNERDKNDSTRKIAPLKRAFDAVEINSDELTAEQVADFIVDYVSEDTE